MNPQQASVELPSAIRVEPLNGNIGAELHHVDLANLSDADFQVIHRSLVEHEVIVMRDQKITLEQQMDFGRRFGPLSIHPFSPNLDDKPEVIVLDYSADNPPALTDQWHADETFRTAPPLATILRARVIPEVGGDTLFSSMSAAYRGLSERMRQYIHGMTALHDFKPWRPLFTNSAQHYAPHDYYPQRRTMERVTVAGDPVIGVTEPYTPQAQAAPLPDGKGIRPTGPRPIRQFER